MTNDEWVAAMIALRREVSRIREATPEVGCRAKDNIPNNLRSISADLGTLLARFQKAVKEAKS
jgi:hypothetical protein